MRYAEIVREDAPSSDLMQRLARLAERCDGYELFVRKTDGEDVLYRGHAEGSVGDNAFMTDYVGHAAEYADGGTIDAFAYNPADVLFYTDQRFNAMRDAYRGLSMQQLAALYRAGSTFARLMMEPDARRRVLGRVRKVLQGTTPYSEVSGNHEVNDMLIPLLQHYAREAHGKNIIAFHGNDYAEYGGQTEYVVSDISKLVDLRPFYAEVKRTAGTGTAQQP